MEGGEAVLRERLGSALINTKAAGDRACGSLWLSSPCSLGSAHSGDVAMSHNSPLTLCAEDSGVGAVALQVRYTRENVKDLLGSARAHLCPSCSAELKVKATIRTLLPFARGRACSSDCRKLGDVHSSLWQAGR